MSAPLVAEPRLRKLPYYARATGALLRAAAPRRSLRLVRHGALALREGPVLRLGHPLDLLLLAEIACFDAYRLRELEDEPGLVVDVGAGIGHFTVLAAARFPRSRVIACEPHPEQLALLAENVARNGCANVELVHAAVGTAPRYAVEGGPRRACSRVRPAGPGEASVTGRTLAELAGPASIDLLKIDCEGAEVDVLESLGPAGLARVRHVALEYHGDREGVRSAELLRAAGLVVDRVPDALEPALGYLYAQPGSASPPQTAARKRGQDGGSTRR